MENIVNNQEMCLCNSLVFILEVFDYIFVSIKKHFLMNTYLTREELQQTQLVQWAT